MSSAHELLTRSVPASGEKLPAVGLGTWQTFDVAEHAPERAALAAVLRTFADLGGRVVDSSPMYGRAERVVGDLAVEQQLHPKLFLATKVWTRGAAAGVRQMEESLSLLRTRRIDLMQVHNLLDWRLHADTLARWKTEGRARYLGITHYHAGAHDELAAVMRTRRFDFVQLNYSLAEPEAERSLLPLAAELGIAVLVNRPYAEGALFRRVQGHSLPPWATEIDCTSWAQFFLKYLLAHPAVTCVLPATRRVEHLQDNMAAGRGRLPDAAMRRRMAQHFATL
jgi:aryl-alcohol dehydrogenase-like predicted oxidoreductase